MLILSRNFCWRADGTWFVSCVCALISHFPEIKTTSPCSAMSLLTHHIDILQLRFFLKSQGFGRSFPIHFYGVIFISVSAISPVCVSVECVCGAWARVCDIIFRMLSSWKTWTKNSLQLDLDPTSFSLHRRCCHFKLFWPLTFRLFSLFSPFFTHSHCIFAGNTNFSSELLTHKTCNKATH